MPRPIQTMLRMYLLQVWFSLSDEGAEEGGGSSIIAATIIAAAS